MNSQLLDRKSLDSTNLTSNDWVICRDDNQYIQHDLRPSPPYTMRKPKLKIWSCSFDDN
jgi:hypothetical protein